MPHNDHLYQACIKSDKHVMGYGLVWMDWTHRSTHTDNAKTISLQLRQGIKIPKAEFDLLSKRTIKPQHEIPTMPPSIMLLVLIGNFSMFSNEHPARSERNAQRKNEP